jgi:4-O-beta-D-mannosyl-D-glucose phosphorylase
VATTTVDRLLDYVLNTPEDPLRSAACVAQRNELIDRNLKFLGKLRGKAAKAYRGVR